MNMDDEHRDAVEPALARGEPAADRLEAVGVTAAGRLDGCRVRHGHLEQCTKNTSSAWALARCPVAGSRTATVTNRPPGGRDAPRKKYDKFDGNHVIRPVFRPITGLGPFLSTGPAGAGQLRRGIDN